MISLSVYMIEAFSFILIRGSLYLEHGVKSGNVVSLSVLKTIIIFLLVLVALVTLTYLLIKEILNMKRLKKAFEEMDMQREELQIKNKDITDSLIYARRIQTALLPTSSLISKLFLDYFILYRPKHIVSGDFYWISETDDMLYLAAADCTGHGVPGALMSMIGLEILQKIINESHTEHSDQILDALNRELESAFNKEEGGKAAIKDGMEVSMCIINTRTKEMEYSGAFLPVYIAREEKLIELKGDKINVGQSIEDVVFTRNTMKIEKDDIIYLFSDGYADQFGGPENKKFMYRRLRHLLVTISKFPMQDQRRILEETIVSWMADTDQIDDMMVMGFRPF
jgi:serine phosphatase RsbU (regulator of sigma subunit)